MINARLGVYIVKEAKRYHHMEACDEWAVTEYKDVQTVPPYHFQLVFVVLHPTVKEFFVTQSQNWTNGRFLNLQSFSTNHDSWFQHTAELSSIT